MFKFLLSSALASALLAFGFTMPSHAQTAARAWVSGHGTDASACGAPTNPCRSFQYVHDNIVKAGGEIDVLDPAGYGAINISKAISIVNDGVGTAGVQQNTSGGTAITINAGAADEITLRGLNIDGLGIAANGIVFNSGGSLSVINCVIRHFIGVANGIGNGILMQPASGMVSALISDTILSDNGSTGFFYYTTSGNAALTAILDKVTATNDFAGVIAYPNGTAQVSISNSVLGKNSYGAQCATTNSGNVKMSVDLSQLNDNGNGISASTGCTLLLSRDMITQNSNYGVFIQNPAIVYTSGDNRIYGNATDVSGTLTSFVTK